MPAELILGHSPPVYSPLLYSPLVVTAPSITSRSVPPRIRPCLASTTALRIDNLRNNNNEGSKQKKRVVFADDRGRPLTQVRVMSEPSSVPPLWSTAYLAGVTGGVTGGVLRSKLEDQSGQELATTPWQVTFPQPASDYLAFRRKLDQENVSLENVIVRENEQCLVGTVKVRNLTYDKEVVVRTSSDSWSTHEDVHCTYVEQPGTPALILYDTFRFRLTLPMKSDLVEFCVRYKTDGQEYWDNNEGQNYVVRKRQEMIPGGGWGGAGNWPLSHPSHGLGSRDDVRQGRSPRIVGTRQPWPKNFESGTRCGVSAIARKLQKKTVQLSSARRIPQDPVGRGHRQPVRRPSFFSSLCHLPFFRRRSCLITVIV